MAGDIYSFHTCSFVLYENVTSIGTNVFICIYGVNLLKSICVMSFYSAILSIINKDTAILAHKTFQRTRDLVAFVFTF